MTAADSAALEQVFAGLSPQSVRYRYLAAVERLTPLMRERLLDVDGPSHLALVAEVGRGRRRTAVGLARFVVDGRDRAEIAYEVADAWQGKGVGTRLLRRLAAEARRRGILCLHGTLLAENEGSARLLRRVLPQAEFQVAGQEVDVTAWLVPRPLEPADLRIEPATGQPILAMSGIAGGP